MAPPFHNVEQLIEHIDDNMCIMYFRGEPQEFLPKQALDDITTKDVIRLVASNEQDFFLQGQELEEFIERVKSCASIMFATCLYAYNDSQSSMKILKQLLDEGLSDQNLPLTRTSCKNEKLKKRMKNFCDNQKRFRVAHFGLNSYHNFDGITKPINLEEGVSNLLGKGAFGEVREIEIHHQHQSFPQGAHRDNKFALKVTQQEGRELNFHKEMANLKHPHLLKCLASFTFSSKYHMIYEKATHDVEDFMQKNMNAKQLDDLTAADLAHQLYGLAAALLVVHNQENGGSSPEPNRLGVPQDKPARSGYIHDIKPDNILLFVYNINGKKKYWLRLSDFSCAKVVDLLAIVSGKRGSHISDNKAGNPTYRAPEMLLELGTSRPYDLWSLGCVYLEMLVWYLDGFQALTAFREEREQTVKPGWPRDDGFCFTDESGPSAKIHLRSAVDKKMKELSRRCTGPLKSIADVLPRLLEIEPTRRPTAAQLDKMLQHLDTGETLPFDYHASEPSGVATVPTPRAAHDDSDSDFSSVDGFFKVTRPSQ